MEAQNFLKTPSATPVGRGGGGRGQVLRGRLRVREQRLLQVVPGDQRHRRVHPGVGAGQHQRQRSAVRAAGHPDPGIVGAVQLDLGLLGQPVDHRAGVRDLVVQRVERDLAGRGAESARRVGQRHESVAGHLLGVGGDRLLRPAEPVGDDHRRCRCAAPAGRPWRRAPPGRSTPGPPGALICTSRLAIGAGAGAGQAIHTTAAISAATTTQSGDLPLAGAEHPPQARLHAVLVRVDVQPRPQRQSAEGGTSRGRSVPEPGASMIDHHTRVPDGGELPVQPRYRGGDLPGSVSVPRGRVQLVRRLARVTDCTVRSGV